MRKDLPLYKYRFFIGFVLLGVFTVAVAAWNFWGLPNGLTSGEMDFVARAQSLDLSKILSGSADLLNLPALLITRAATDVLGFNTFAFRLGSVIFALLSAGVLTTLFAVAIRKNVAVIAGFLLVSSSAFLSMARVSGGASFATLLLSLIILIAFVLVRRKAKGVNASVLKIALCVIAALLAYSPGGIFAVLMLLIVGLAHPTSRYEIFRNKWWKIALGALLALAIISPIIWSCVRVEFNSDILGFSSWKIANVGAFTQALFGVNGFAAGALAPTFNVAILILAGYGVYKIARDIMSGRALLFLSLLVLLVVLAIGDPQQMFWMFVPVGFLLAVGVNELLSAWFSLFPRNPYARIFGLLPIVILTVWIGWSSVYDYILAGFYDANVVYATNREFDAVRENINNDTRFVVVPKSQIAFYKGLKIATRDIEITDKIPKKAKSGSVLIVASASNQSNTKPLKIVTTYSARDSVLLRKY